MMYRKSKLITIILIIILSTVSLGLIVAGSIAKLNDKDSSAATTITSIRDFDDLKQFRDSVNAGNNYQGITVTLYNDIDMQNDKWTPIRSGFKGTFEGNGYVIKNYSGQNGLFSELSGEFTYIQNLNVVANRANQGIVGSIKDYAKIRNCSMFGSINATHSNTGGIVGNMQEGSVGGGYVTSCQNFATISGGGYHNIGGIAGNGWDGYISGCINFGSIGGMSCVGGITGLSSTDLFIGRNHSTKNCINLGQITGSEYVGGIVGRNQNRASNISKCYNASTNGVKGAGEKDDDKGNDYTTESIFGNFYCLTVTQNDLRDYLKDDTKWDSNSSPFTSDPWMIESKLNLGWPVLNISIIDVTVNAEPSECGNSGNFNMVMGESVTSYGNVIRCNGVKMYEPTPSRGTNWVAVFTGFSGVPSGAQYSDFTITANFTKEYNDCTVTIRVDDDSVNYGYLEYGSTTYKEIKIDEVPYGSLLVITGSRLNIQTNESTKQIYAKPYTSSNNYETYLFEGWYSNNKKITNTISIKEDIEIVAKFKVEYKTYDINLSVMRDVAIDIQKEGIGGTLGNSTNSTIEDLVYDARIVLPNSDFIYIYPSDKDTGHQKFLYYQQNPDEGYEFVEFQYSVDNRIWREMDSQKYLNAEDFPGLTETLYIRAVFKPLAEQTVTFEVDPQNYGTISGNGQSGRQEIVVSGVPTASIFKVSGESVSLISSLTGYTICTITARPADVDKQFTYKFDGWTNANNEVLSGGITIYADFITEVNSYSIELSSWDKCDTDTITEISGTKKNIRNIEYDTYIGSSSDRLSIGGSNYNLVEEGYELLRFEYSVNRNDWTSMGTQLLWRNLDDYILESETLYIRAILTRLRYTVTFEVDPTYRYGTISEDVLYNVPYGTTFSSSKSNPLIITAPDNYYIINTTAEMEVFANPYTSTDEYEHKFESWDRPNTLTRDTTIYAEFSRGIKTYDVAIDFVNVNEEDPATHTQMGKINNQNITEIAEVAYGGTIVASNDTLTLIPRDDDLKYTADQYTYSVSANEGFNFIKLQYLDASGVWQDFDSTVVLTVTQDLSLRALFERIVYNVTVLVNTHGYGTLSSSIQTGVDIITISGVPYGTTFTKQNNRLNLSRISGYDLDTYQITANPTENTARYTYGFDSWENVPDADNYTDCNNIIANFTREVNYYAINLSIINDNEDGNQNIDEIAYFEKSVTREWAYGAYINIDSMPNKLTIVPSYEDEKSTASEYEVIVMPRVAYEFIKYEYSFDEGTTWHELNEDIMLTGTMYIRAVISAIEYYLPLSYIANENGTYNTKYIEFNIESNDIVFYTDIEDFLNESEQEYIKGIGKEFGAWIIGDQNVLDDNNLGYSISFDDKSPGTLILTSNLGSDYGVLKFKYNDTLVGLNGNTYYCVTTLISGSYGRLMEKTITTKWSNLYNIELSNNPGNSIWNNATDAGEYLGVNGDGEVNVSENAKNTLSFQVRFNENYKYPFMSSYMDRTYLPFYKGSEYTDALTARSNVGSYYIYNYGYEIVAWTIRFDYGGTRYYLYVNNNAWEYRTNEISSNIEALASSQTMNDMSLYADKLDELLAFDGSANPTIYMIPTWQAVDIEIRTIKNDVAIELAKINYGDTYMFDVNKLTNLLKTGESIIYFNAETGNNIIVMGTGSTIYNYKDLSYSQYTTPYQSGNSNKYKDVIYVLNVVPYYVDNIYRVNLNGAKTDAEGNYIIENPDLEETPEYIMANNTTYSLNTYTYKDFGYSEYVSGYIEDYANGTLGPYRADYERKINDGTLEPLRKIYGTNGAFYIYLANDQPTGELPVFFTDYYDLIFWVNDNWSVLNRDKTYIYKTRLYIDELHSSEAEGYTEHEDGIWRFDDGSTSTTVSFTAFYFRKNYKVEVQTLLNETNGRYGYVIVEFIDEMVPTGEDCKSGRYLAIYDESEMSYYEFNGSSIPADLTTLVELNELPVLYAGCRVKIDIYDQSQDPDLMDRGAYDELIGYRYVESEGVNIDSGNVMFANTSEYAIELTKEEIEGQGNITNSTYQIKATFEKIKYDTIVRMQEPRSGTFRITYPDGSVSAYVTELNIQDMELGDVYYITYNAYTGYEYSSNAYTLILPNGQIVLLQNRDHWIESGEQVYVMQITGTWLRENYYTNYDRDYTVDDANIGTIQVNTDEIEFEYRIKVYDSSKTDETAWIGEILADNSWRLSDGTINLSKAFSALSMGGYGYIHTNGEEYAILSSYVYEPRNPMNRTRYFASYDFLCLDKPTREYEINTDMLYYMVDTTEVYEIVPEGSRTIYMTIDVREIYRIGLTVEALPNDTNSTTRTTTISNGTNNTIVLETNARATLTGNVYTTGEIYTYYGLTNSISSNYDTNRYSGVEYYLDEVKLEGNTLAVEQDSELVIRYIPNAIPVQIRYELDGQTVDRQALNGILTEFEVIGNSEVYLGSELVINYAVASDYNIRVEINGKELIGNSYTVQDSDYDEGQVEIAVKVNTQPNEEISIRIVQSDSRKVLADDDEGTVSVYVDNELQEGNEGIRVIEGKRVEISIDLNRGYTYYGYKRNNGAIDRSALTGNRLVISTSFDIARDSGEYTIYVSKEDVTAVMDQTTNNATNYTIEGGTKRVENTSTTLTGLYVGKTITFNRLEDLAREELAYYYYISGDGSYVAIMGNELKITSELLEEVGSNEIRVGVVSVNKYKLTIEVISGIDYAIVNTDQPIEANGLPVYYRDGSEIEVELTSIEEGKYIIRTEGALQTTGQTRVEASIRLDSDKEIKVYVEPDRYIVGVSEYVYTSISDQASGTPTLETSPISDVKTSGQGYKEIGVISFRKESLDADRKLTKIVIQERGKASIEITIVEGRYEITSSEEIGVQEINGEYTIELGEKEYTLTDLGERIEISYITEEDISLRLEYTMTKEIRP